MIPLAFLHEWVVHAPWPDLRQVEQDLIICRALCDLFSSDALAGKIAFRGGTAIHKLLFSKPLRYSEDIDLVQLNAEPIGPTVDAIRKALAWLGNCRREWSGHSMHLVYRFAPEAEPTTKLAVKIELNTREHRPFYAIRHYPFEIRSDWHSARAEIAAYEPEELFGTKLRALLQRNRSRDLFDLGRGLTQLALDADKTIKCLRHYLDLESAVITRANAEQRMLEKLGRSLIEDVAPLLPNGISFTEDEAVLVFNRIWKMLIARIPGESWKSSESVIESLRNSTVPNLLTE